MAHPGCAVGHAAQENFSLNFLEVMTTEAVLPTDKLASAAKDAKALLEELR